MSNPVSSDGKTTKEKNVKKNQKNSWQKIFASGILNEKLAKKVSSKKALQNKSKKVKKSVDF